MSASVASGAGRPGASTEFDVRTHGRRRLALLAAILPAAFLLATFVGPLARLLLASVQNSNGRYTLDHYRQVWSTGYYVDAIWQTVLLAVMIMITCVIGGYLMAVPLARSRSRAVRGLVLVAVLSPLLTSVIVRNYGWLVLLAPNGVVARVWELLTQAAAPQMLYNVPAAFVATTHVLMPFAALTIAPGIGDVPRHLETASTSLGASAARTFFRITLPLSLPAVTVAATLVFLLAMGIYVTPLVVGGDTVPFLGIRVYQTIFQLGDYPTASALGFSLALVTAVGTAVLLVLFAWVRKMGGVGAR